MNGRLILPQSADIIDIRDDELGVLFQVKPAKSPVFLYANPPAKQLRRVVKGHAYQLTRVADTQFPAVLMSENDQHAIGIQQQLMVGERVIARQAPEVGEDVFEVITFKPKDKQADDMPEAGLGIEIINKGYMFKHDLQKDPEVHETFRRDKSDLFPNKDLIKDIRQNIFGDCFLLSSILGILHQPGGEEYIKSMMVKDGNATIVRLYDPNTAEPVYYRIQNTVHHQNDISTVNHRALWVHILEKAYTAHAQKHSPNKNWHGFNDYYYSYPSFRDMFGAGGKPSTAMKILTGQDANEQTVYSTTTYPWHRDNLIFCSVIYSKIKPVCDKLDDEDLQLLEGLLDDYEALEQGKLISFARSISDFNGEELAARIGKLDDPAHTTFRALTFLIKDAIGDLQDEADISFMLNAFSNYILQYADKQSFELAKTLDSIRLVAIFGKFLQEQEDLFDFIEAVDVSPKQRTMIGLMASLNEMQRRNVPAPVMEKFTDYAEGMKFTWDGDLGTGHYTPLTEKIFTDLSQHFSRDDFLETEAVPVLAASTRKTFPEKVPGLRTLHAYAITGVSQEKDGPLKYVHVRNPWGRVGRKYHFDNRYQREHRRLPLYEEDRSEEAAEFKVELSDFARYFGDYSVGQFVPDPELKLMPWYQEGYAVPRPERPGFFERNFGKILGAPMGAIIGGLIGAAAGAVLAPFTFGLSIAIGAAVGAAIGSGIGLGIGAAVDRHFQNSDYIDDGYSPLRNEEVANVDPFILHRRNSVDVVDDALMFNDRSRRTNDTSLTTVSLFSEHDDEVDGLSVVDHVRAVRQFRSKL